MKLFKKPEPKTVEVKGNALCCPVCDNKYFWSRKALLTSAVSTFFNLDWTDRNATCFVCSECTYVFWFLA